MALPGDSGLLGVLCCACFRSLLEKLLEKTGLAFSLTEDGTMASLRKHGGKTNFWYALFRDAGGRLVERSTKTTDRRRAQELADEWERLARPSAGARTVENMRRVIAEMHRRYLKEEAPKMTLEGYRDHWLMAKRPEVSAATMTFYESSLKRFVAFLGPRAQSDLFAIGKTDLVRFRDARRQVVAGKTVNHELKVLRQLFRTAKEDGWIAENPMDGLKSVREDRAEKSPKRPFTVEELQRVLSIADAEWRAMIIRGYYTGQRLKDIALMRAEQEDVATGQVVFWTSKTDQRIVVEMAPAFREWALNLDAADDPKQPLHPRAFAAVNASSQQRTSTVSGQFADLLVKAGLRHGGRHRKKQGGQGRAGRKEMAELTFHSLRHSLVSHLQDAGVSRSIVQDIVGHESEEINAVYTKLDRGTKQAAMAKLPDITT